MVISPRTYSQLSRTLIRGSLPFIRLGDPDSGWAVICPELGAKILGAGLDEENAFWVSPQIARGDWRAGGQRTWLAPELGEDGFFGTTEEDWRVSPELDPGHYATTSQSTAQCTCESLSTVLTASGARYPVVLQRQVELIRKKPTPGHAARSLHLRFSHTLINCGSRTVDRKIGLWSIAQVPNDLHGTFLIPLSRPSDRRGARQRGRDSSDVLRRYFGELPTSWVAGTPDLLALRSSAGLRYKVGIPPRDSVGTLAYLRPSFVGVDHILVLKRFPVDEDGAHLDGPLHFPADGASTLATAETYNGDVAQCYNSPDLGSDAFAEIECHTPAITLHPGDLHSAIIDLIIAKGKPDALLGFMGTVNPASFARRYLPPA